MMGISQPLLAIHTRGEKKKKKVLVKFKKEKQNRKPQTKNQTKELVFTNASSRL